MLLLVDNFATCWGKGLEALTLLIRLGAATLSKAIRVKYEKGVLKPLEPLILGRERS
ncbi:antitoxin family protein [Aeropyrum camini]|uniref:antitoxin family protein n=1 Tax=Aeropyrum camini TaxID=229980 RepID=UPI0009E67854